MNRRLQLTACVALFACLPAPVSSQPKETTQLITALESAEGIKKTWGTNVASSAVELSADPRFVSEGKASLKLSAAASAAEGNQYLGAMIPVKPFDVAAQSLLLDAWSSIPEHTHALYVRLYDETGKVIGS